MKNKLLIIVLLIIPGIHQAQNITSPYSILGIGDVETKDFGRYFITGNTASSRRDGASYNNANPAALTALPYKTMHFDMAFRGRSSYYTLPSTGERTATSKDFTIKRGTLAFKVTKKTGIAFGIQPYSTVNYQFSETAKITDGTDSYLKITEGTGGIPVLCFCWTEFWKTYFRRINQFLALWFTSTKHHLLQQQPGTGHS